MNPLRYAFPVLLPLIAAGCGLFSAEGRTDETIRIGRGKVAILPFSMRGRSYFESAVGAHFGRDIVAALREPFPNANIDGPDEVPEDLAREYADVLHAGDVMGNRLLLQIGERLGATYVVAGEIHTIRGKDPKSFGVLKGTMVVSARIVDVPATKLAWRLDRKTFNYPPRLLGREEIPADEADEATVLKKLMQEAAKGLVEPFTGRKRTLGEDVHRALH
jgi:hypothetical protein